MSNFCRGGDVAPNTFAAQDPLLQMEVVASLERKRRTRVRLAAEAIKEANHEEGEKDD